MENSASSTQEPSPQTTIALAEYTNVSPMVEEPAPESASASRQKSCNACVKAKRGCDKRHPVCSRCEEKKISCNYAKRSYAEAFRSDFDFDPVESDMSWAGLTGPSSSIDLVDCIPASPATCLPTFESFIDPFLTFADSQAATSSDMQLISSVSARRQLGQQQENQQGLSKFDYAPMADICVRYSHNEVKKDGTLIINRIQYEPWQVYDPNTKAHFIVQSLKSYPSTFAKDSHTPWMHGYLYKDQMPSSIQSCFTVSALYSNMTSNNKASVFRVLYQSLNELKQQQQLANTPLEKLARAQALFLYQIICLFDGDLTLRSDADRDMLLLQDWLDDLCKIRENLSTLESDRPKSWEVGAPILLSYSPPSLTAKVVDIFRVCPTNHRHSLCLPRAVESDVQK